ncbi:TraH family protein [Bradyrhizobium sp. LA2.1]|uniref:TraH family protein n=1 Tax=Bradyrhizobium sp. LA2.1 TaxID=3156376 RepID=UPI0033933EE6
MIDAATIHQCADPGLKPGVVEKFIRVAGSPDPLAVTIRAGNRVILVMPPKTPDDAMELVRRYVGQAMVRVGVTQYPAGLGVTDVAELKPDLVDVCANIRMGTALFGKVYRIVVKWYGAPVDEAFGDAIDAWKTGYFDGKYVFDQPDPGSLPAHKDELDIGDKPLKGDDAAKSATVTDNGARQVKEPDDPNKAGIRIDLTVIGVDKPK